LLAATVRSFAHMPLGISDRNTPKKIGLATSLAVVEVEVTTSGVNINSGANFTFGDNFVFLD